MTWKRVTKQHRCTVCDKPDWCGYTDEVACCMRVQSSTPAHNGGWIHPLNSDHHPRTKQTEDEIKPYVDWQRRWQKLSDGTSQAEIEQFAASLGVMPSALHTIGCARDHHRKCWCFPMRDGLENIIGIRTRSDDGEKKAIWLSSAGIFTPKQPSSPPLFICEGPTDTAAMLSIGAWAIGRPSCQGCIEHTVTYIRRHQAKQAVIVADHDAPGQSGAVVLQAAIRNAQVRSIIWTPLAKDAREWVKRGGTFRMIKLHERIWI